MQKGKLYLLPVPLGEDEDWHTIPEYVVKILHTIDYFVAERAKTARHFIKRTQPTKPLNALHFEEITSTTDLKTLETYLQPIENGHDIGILSEAGCPCIADPGASLVALAHRKGIEVVPLVGPSSILLALIGSGMSGQKFAFHGYLSAKKDEVPAQLRTLEQQSQRSHQTQIFMEAPYRNTQIIDASLKNLAPDTLFCIASDLTLATQSIQTFPIKVWKQRILPDLHKKLAIFLLYSGK
jgi:16S rRNA (cytidine1402-2'-O)-methyltransferase